MMESGTAQQPTGHEVSRLRETPSALRDAISQSEEDHTPTGVCPGCGDPLWGVPKNGRVEGDWDEEYCSISCLNKVYANGK